MMESFLSLIVPVYNALPYLHQCLDSIVGQPLPHLEVILVDDGSDDGSSQVCRAYAAKHSFIKLLQQENSGVLKARQKGAAEASGKYIGFVDADDWIEPAMYERLYSAAQLSNADLVVCDYFKHTADSSCICRSGLEPGLYTGEFYENKLLLNLFCDPHRSHFSPLCTQWNALIEADRARAELALLPPGLCLGEDTAFIMGCAIGSSRFIYVNEAFYHYRLHGDSAIHRDWGRQPSILSAQRFLLYQYLIRRSQDRLICNILGQLESYMLFLAQLDLRNFFSSSDEESIVRYLSSPWLRDLRKEEQGKILPPHWAKVLSALSPD